MKILLVYCTLMGLLFGCFGSKTPLPDKRTQVPGSVKVNNYLDQVTTPSSIHCLEDSEDRSVKAKSYFHDGYAKISTNHVGREISHPWDDSWNNMIGETLDDKYPELISEETKLHEGELVQMGCPGFSVASKEDKKRFWALFLASLARVQSGFDPSFRENNNSGLFALEPARVTVLGGECEGKDEIDFLEPSYSFGCALKALKSQQSSNGRLFSEGESEGTIFKSLTGPARFEFIKFFKAHASSQFSFCSSGVSAPSELTQTNTVGEKKSDNCSSSERKKIHGELDREDAQGKGFTDKTILEKKGTDSSVISK